MTERLLQKWQYVWDEAEKLSKEGLSASKMAQWVEMLATKPEYPSLIPRTGMVEGVN